MATATHDLPEKHIPEKHIPRKNGPRRSWLVRICRWILWTLLILIVLILIVLGVAYYLAGTDSGFARLSSLANKHVAGLEIEASSGNLQTGISAGAVSFSNDTIDIKAAGLNSAWQLNCLLEKRFCLDDLHIEELDVTTRAAEVTEPAEPRTGAIELPDIALPIDVSISDVSIGVVRFQGPGDVPVQVINDIELSASTEDSVVTIDNLSLAYQPYSASLAGNIELQGEYPLELTLAVNADDVLPDSVPEGVGKQPLQIDSQLSGSLTNLTIDAVISGVADVTIGGNVQALEQNLPATISIVSDTLGWPVETKSQVLASGTRIDVSGDMSDYTFSVDTQVSGDQIPETGINVRGIANMERLSVPDIDINTLGGTLDGSALVSLAQPMVWDTRWRIEDIDPSLQVPDLDGKLNGDIQANGSVDDGRWSLKLEQATIEGVLRELPFLLDARVSKGLNDIWLIERLALNNDRNEIKAQGIVSDTLDIRADVNLPQLQNLMPGLAGGFDAKLLVDGELASPDVNIDAIAEVLRFNDILVQSLVINGDINELFISDSQLDVTVDTVQVGENTVSDTSIAMSGKRRDHTLALRADGPQQTSIELALSGDLDESFNWTGLLEKAQAVVPEHTVSLNKAVAIDWQNGRQLLSVSPHCWSLAEGSNLCLQDEFNTGTAGNTNITLDSYELQKLNAFLPDETRIGGNLGADVALSWGDGGPNDRRAVVSALIDDATVNTVDGFGDSIEFGYDSIALDADVTPDDAKADIKLSSESLGNAALSVQLDPSDADSAIEGTVDLQGLQLSIAKAFLPDFDEVSGTLGAKGDLGGSLSAPLYNGNIVLDSPKLQSDILPLPLTGGKIIANISGQNMTLDGELLSDKGRIDITGRGTLDPQRWNTVVTLKGKDLNIQSDPLQESIVNHDIRIQANARRLTINGDIDIPFAVIDVEELPQGAATVSSDVVVIEDIEEEAEEDASMGASTGLELAVELDVSLGEEVSLSAYGLDANLTGDMDVRIRGERPPQLGGEIRVVDGIFKKYGQDLVANGQIIFVGPIDGTRLDIAAVRTIENEEPERQAGLRIEGTVAVPELILFTEPADKSQDAILSYIILGRDINEASDQEANLLATAALALAVKGGSSIGGGVANALGIKEFGFESSGSGENAELIVSGRINDRLLLRYGRGVFDSQSTLYLRYDLTKKLYLEAAQGSLQQAVDLFYSFSF